MPSPATPERDKNHRWPGESLRHGVWLSYRFPLRCRDVQKMLLARGIDVPYASIRPWGRKFGPADAHQRRRRRPRPGAPWPLAEGFVRINGTRHAQRVLAAYGPMAQHCRPRRPLLSASAYRHEMRQRCENWADVTGTERTASRVERTGMVPPCA